MKRPESLGSWAGPCKDSPGPRLALMRSRKAEKPGTETPAHHTLQGTQAHRHTRKLPNTQFLTLQLQECTRA